MVLQTSADVNLTRRALVSGWLDNFDERRRKAVHDLFDVVENSADPELRVKAFQALIKADEADLKRKIVELKKQEADDARRIRLLAILQSLPAGELSKIASGHEGTGEE